MKRIIIDFIPHKDQRYNTCGDWVFTYYDIATDTCKPSDPEVEVLHLRISKTSDWRSSTAVAVHELVEALLCKHASITTEQVDQFDMNWKPHDGFTEPGDDPNCPCYAEHNRAEIVEAHLCKWLGLSWAEHEHNIGVLDLER